MDKGQQRKKKGFHEVKSKIDCSLPEAYKKRKIAASQNLPVRPGVNPTIAKHIAQHVVSSPKKGLHPNVVKPVKRRPLSGIQAVNQGTVSVVTTGSKRKQPSNLNGQQLTKRRKLCDNSTVEKKVTIKPVSRLKQNSKENMKKRKNLKGTSDTKTMKRDARKTPCEKSMRMKYRPALGSFWCGKAVENPFKANFKTIGDNKIRSDVKSACNLPNRRNTLAVSHSRGTSAAPMPENISKRHSIATAIRCKGQDTNKHVREPQKKQCKVKPQKSILKVTQEAAPSTPVGQVITEVKTPRSVRFRSPMTASIGHQRYPKTPVGTSPFQKDMAAREQLEAWCREKGKSVNQYRHLKCFGHHLSAKIPDRVGNMRTVLSSEQSKEPLANVALQAVVVNLEKQFAEDEVKNDDNSQPDKLQRLLNECSALHDAGYPVVNVIRWLDDIERNIPECKKKAEYWVTRAKVIGSQGETAATVAVLEQAITQGAQPAELVAKSMREFVLNMKLVGASEGVEEADQNENFSDGSLKCTTRRSSVQETNTFESSTVKYCVTENVTCLKKLAIAAVVSASHPIPTAVVTPVRRSTRKSITELPTMLQDHDRIVANLNNLSFEYENLPVYVPNSALIDESL